MQLHCCSIKVAYLECRIRLLLTFASDTPPMADYRAFQIHEALRPFYRLPVVFTMIRLV